MAGLDSKRFFNYLAANDLRLYVHEITAYLLLHDARYRHLKPYLVELAVDEPFMLPVPRNVAGNENEGDTITVTLLPAGHCPGSVMFLFEGSEGTVLYTGDIRLSGDDLMEMPALKAGEKVKAINSIYFDSTFCTHDTVRIVDRKESLRAVVNLARAHLNENKNNKVLLYCAQKYGHEFLMCKMSEELKMKIHVTGSKRALYEKIPDIGRHVTDDGLATRLHACAFYTVEDDELTLNSRRPNSSPKYHGKRPRHSIPCCPECRSWDKNVMIIKPSMLWFQQSRSIRDVVYYDERGGCIYRVQYSCHSSLSEIRELLRYLRPQNAYPNVVPFRSKDYSLVHEAIADLVPSIRHCSPKKFDALLRLTSSPSRFCENGERRYNDNRKSEFEPNFAGRKRFIESVLAQQTKRSLFDEKPAKRAKKERPPPESWDACIQLSDSEFDSASDSSSQDQDNETSDSRSSCCSDSESTSSSSLGIVHDSENVLVQESKKAVNASNGDTACASNGDTTAPCVDTETSGATSGQDPCVIAKGAEAPLDIIEEDQESSLILRLSGCSDQSPRQSCNDQTLDSDVDLFDPIVRADDDDDDVEIIEEKEEPAAAATLTKAISRDSLEFIGVFQKNANPPVITICSQEQDDSLWTSSSREQEQLRDEDRTSTVVVGIEETKEAETIDKRESSTLKRKTNEERTPRVPMDKESTIKKSNERVQSTVTRGEKELTTVVKKTNVNQKPSSAAKPKAKASKKEVTPSAKTKKARRKRSPSPNRPLLQQILDDDDEDRAWLLAAANRATAASTTKNGNEMTSGRQIKSQI